MLAWLLLLFIVLPLTELAILLVIAQYTSALFALGLVIGTGIIGMLLVRSQGVHTITRLRHDLAAGRLPADTLWDAGLILVAAGMLLTPGVLTDLTGLLLLVPPTRKLARAVLTRWLARHFHVVTGTTGAHGPTETGDRVVDGEVVEQDR